jgi:hypothetical protein
MLEILAYFYTPYGQNRIFSNILQMFCKNFYADINNSQVLKIEGSFSTSLHGLSLITNDTDTMAQMNHYTIKSRFYSS